MTGPQQHAKAAVLRDHQIGNPIAVDQALNRHSRKRPGGEIVTRHERDLGRRYPHQYREQQAHAKGAQ